MLPVGLAIALKVRGNHGDNLPLAAMRLDHRIGILPSRKRRRSKGGVAMEDLFEMESGTESEESRVYAWRVEQLARLGLSNVIADAVASFVDWHDVAHLVEKGCAPELALEIAR
jgi:hypothetical protein